MAEESNAETHVNAEVEFCRSKAQQYRQRYESMRTLEWQSLLQTYAGYAAIAVVVQKADAGFDSCQSLTLFRVFVIIATLIFFIGMHYLHYRIEERLIKWDQFSLSYDRKIRRHSGARDLQRSVTPDREPETSDVGHAYFWTYDTQMALSTITAVGLLVYECLYKSALCGCYPVGLWLKYLVGAILLCFLATWAVLRAGLQRTRDQWHAKGNLVWYASYGSNLAYRNRFLCYIAGGMPAGSTKRNPGCRDNTPPWAVMPITLNHELFFAGHFEGWNGAAAFVRQSEANVNVLGRMYLITAEQFNDVVLQENGLKPDGRRIVPSVTGLERQSEHLLKGVDAYERLLVVGTNAGFPILTFTSKKDDGALPIGPPSEPYLKIIAAGIRETYPAMQDQEIIEYLARAEGVRGQIQPEQLAQWVRGSTALVGTCGSLEIHTNYSATDGSPLSGD